MQVLPIISEKDHDLKHVLRALAGIHWWNTPIHMVITCAYTADVVKELMNWLLSKFNQLPQSLKGNHTSVKEKTQADTLFQGKFKL